MHKLSICVLSLFVTSGLWANTRMPVVNIAAGGVSARSAFGEEIVKNTKKINRAKAQVYLLKLKIHLQQQPLTLIKNVLVQIVIIWLVELLEEMMV